MAIARAIVNQPSLLLADEPTGNLDTKTSRQIMGIFHELHGAGITIIIVTHELDVAAQADRIIQMSDGKVVEDTAVDAGHRREILAISRETHKRMFEQKRAVRPDARSAPHGEAERSVRQDG